MPLTLRVTQSPESTMWRAALAWVASASSSSGGEKSEAKKIANHSPQRTKSAVERPGRSEGTVAGAGAASGAERIEGVVMKAVLYRINGRPINRRRRLIHWRVGCCV